MRCGGDWRRAYGDFYTGTKGETPDTAKELPTDYRASSRPYPRRPWRDQDFLCAETLQQPIEVGSVAAVAIPHQIRRGGLVWKRFADLLACPRRRRMVGDIHMNNAAAVVGQNDEDKQHPERRRWDGEEIH